MFFKLLGDTNKLKTNITSKKNWFSITIRSLTDTIYIKTKHKPTPFASI